uniref:Uncharacterized protein n=1 Tax=Onchocerca volvulus TaxID=6282 RepID=A0A8R1XV65_ONCVO
MQSSSGSCFQVPNDDNALFDRFCLFEPWNSSAILSQKNGAFANNKYKCRKKRIKLQPFSAVGEAETTAQLTYRHRIYA